MNDISQKKKINIVALFGESGSGKDTIQKHIVANYPNTHGIVSCTTRPRRDNEADGIDYYFLTNEQFAEDVLNGNMLEATDFNNWFYGTRINELDNEKINIGVFNIAGIECLLTDDRLNIIPVYIASTDKERLLRILARESNPNCHEICRRFLADEKDFDNIDFEFKTICNNTNEFSFTEIQISRLIKHL